LDGAHRQPVAQRSSELLSLLLVLSSCIGKVINYDVGSRGVQGGANRSADTLSTASNDRSLAAEVD
jgi:hypothetical protein